jgi:putative DNA primase/helicase
LTIRDFETALINYGLVPTEVVHADGQFHRCHGEGDKPKSKNGWYVLNTDGHRFWGAYGNWARGDHIVWRAHSEEGVPREGDHVSAMPVASPPPLARDFDVLWEKCESPDPSHPYLARKRVRPFGIRQRNGNLIVPVRRIDGELVGLQRIHANGEKRFYSGTQKRSAMHVIGDWDDTILIAEGYATAATCFMATGHCSVVSFDAGNLADVGQTIRERFREAKLVFMADADPVGIAAATEAAEKSFGSVLTPEDITIKGRTD